MAWSAVGNIKGPPGTGGNDIPVTTTVDSSSPYAIGEQFAGEELRFSKPGPTAVVFNVVRLPENSRGLIRNLNGQPVTFQACPTNVAGRCRVAAMVMATFAPPTLPGGFTAFAAAVNGAVLGTVATTGSDSDTLTIPSSGFVVDLASASADPAINIDAVAYTPTQNLTMPASFTPVGATAAADNERAYLFISAITSASGISSLDVATPIGWTFVGKRQGDRAVVALFIAPANAGPVPMPTVSVVSVGVGTSLSVSAVLMVAKPAVTGFLGVSGAAYFGEIPRPGGAILKSTKATPAVSTANALAAWSVTGNTVYLNGELDP